jgi:hypothetical protein
MRKALHRNPKRRFPSAGEIGVAIRQTI